jgi:hypothetical protein
MLSLTTARSIVQGGDRLMYLGNRATQATAHNEVHSLTKLLVCALVCI